MKGSTKTVYADKSGSIINASKWSLLRSNKEYYVIKEFEDDKVAIVAEWVGKQNDGNVVPQAYWKLFKVSYYNIIITGDRPGTFTKKSVIDPSMTLMFKSEAEAVVYYRELLESSGRLKASENYEGEMEFFEIGNKRAKAAVEDEATVVTIKTKGSIVGSW